jgi:hypothetical protein
VEEVFVIAFHALNRRVDYFNIRAALFDYALADALDGLFAGFGVADDAAFGYVLSTGFELGFDEDDGGTLPGLLRSA